MNTYEKRFKEQTGGGNGSVESDLEQQYRKVRKQYDTFGESLSNLRKECGRLETALKKAQKDNQTLTEELNLALVKIKTLENDQASWEKRRQNDFHRVTALLEQEVDGLADQYAWKHTDQAYADRLYKWIPALQELIGLAHALEEDEEVDPGIRQDQTHLYLQKLRGLRLDDMPALEVSDIRAEWEALKKGGPNNLGKLSQWWERIRKEARQGTEEAGARQAAEALWPTLEALRAMEPKDCLTGKGLELLWAAAMLADAGIRAMGYFPAFYGAEDTQKQICLHSDVKAAFNRGSDDSVEVPAVFRQRSGRWELVNGFVGETQRKTLEDRQ